MTAANMARYRGDPNYKFWEMLKEGYDHFEITKVPPKVDVCEKRYVFNQVADGNAAFSPTGACPPSTTPAGAESAYQSYRRPMRQPSQRRDVATPAPKPSILGIKEAKVGIGMDAQAGARRTRADRAAFDAGRRLAWS